jgi:N-acetylglutamate synthase-like GNAT family acetyltransferase
MKFCFITPVDPAYQHELMLRWEMLFKPLGLPPGGEIEAEEKKSIHLIALEKKKLVGCVVFSPESATAGKVHQMAFSEEYQDRGFGRKLIATLEQSLIKQGIKEVYLLAPPDKVGFYERVGYTCEGAPQKERGIFYQRMNKRLQLT